MNFTMLNNIPINIKIYDLLIYYIIYSFLGWCIEVGYAYKNQRKFVNRGFLNGPLCPIYGAAVLCVVLTLSNFNYNIFIMFIISTILTSLVEYITGFLLEKLFKKRYWDYTEDPFNLHGRICLQFSVMWGSVCLIIIKFIHPMITSFITIIPKNFRLEVSLMFFIFILIDFIYTLNSLVNFKNIMYKFQMSNTSINLIDNDTKNFQTFIEEMKIKFSHFKKD